MTGPRPLVVTLALDEAAQRRFDRERAALFPPGRTAVGAHVTLFHALPGAESARVEADVREAVRRPGFDVEVTGVMFLGRGAAYRLESPSLMELHGTLRARWEQLLTAQDRQPFRPHVTVQNKVAPQEARATVVRLRGCFAPVTVRATGVTVWRYDGGPWSRLADHPFDGSPPSGTLEPHG
jgi:2'-5' RNA ligase